MKKFILFLAVLAVAGLAVSYWWQENYPSVVFRYKMTVVVDTPEGIKTGAAVRQVKIYTGWTPLPEMGPSIKIKGGAIVVDLGANGVLICPLLGLRNGVVSADYAYNVLWTAFPANLAPLSREGLFYYSSLKGERIVLRPDYYPMFL